jgi:protein involved in polysaccharide export with SLBB domain
MMRTILLLPALLCSLATAHAQNAPAPNGQEYVAPGDVVKLWVWREEELSGEFLVPESGVVVFPKIGAQKVTDRPMPQLRDALLTEFKKYLRNPSIEVTFLRRVNILGAVRKAGVYTLDPTMTIAMAVAMAEGATDNGRADRVVLIRDGERLVTNIDQKTKIGDLPIQSGDQLFVPERSWVSRNMGLVAAAVSGLFGLVSVLIAVSQ